MATADWELLAGLSPEGISEILALASSSQLSEGAVLFRLGDEAKKLFLVRSGRVRLTFPMRIGSHQEDILAEERLPGQMVGWSSLIPPHRFTLQAVAAVDTELLVLAGAGPPSISFWRTQSVGYSVVSNLAQIVGQRLALFQTMWIRELQRVVESQTCLRFVGVARRPGADPLWCLCSLSPSPASPVANRRVSRTGKESLALKAFPPESRRSGWRSLLRPFRRGSTLAPTAMA